MRKLFPCVAAVLAAMALLSGLLGDRTAVERARTEARQLAHQRDSLLTIARESERGRAALAEERQAREAVIDGLLDSVAALERDRARHQVSVREIRTSGALMDRLRAAFPELGDSAWGLATVPFEPGDTIGIEVLMVPAWFAETFAIDRANAASWRAQQDRLVAADSLRLAVTALQDSVARLADAAAVAYLDGYRSAHDAYGALSERYLAELRRPRFQSGSVLGFILGAGTGMLAAELIHR
jgi:hypothetical protein